MSAPRLARLLIRLFVPAAWRDDVLGDLEEAHRLRHGGILAWFRTIGDASAIAGAQTWRRIHDAAQAGPGRLVSRTDVRLGLRLMVRQPILTLTGTVSLAVGIGLAAVGFSFMHTVLFSRLPFPDGDRFVLLRVLQEPQRTPAQLTPDSYRALAASATTLEYVGGLTSGQENVTLPSGDVFVATTAGITPSALRYLPWAPREGRLLVPQDGAAGAPAVAMIRDGFRERAFGDGTTPIGATIEISGVTRTVVGVVPDDFKFPNTPDVLLPIDEGFLAGRGLPDSDVGLFGVLAPGRSLRAAREELRAMAPALAAGGRSNGPLSVDVTTFTDLGPMGTALAATIVAFVVAVLLVVAANVGNLVLARSFARTREFALRSALGASRRRLVGQVFSEVFLLAGTAAIVGTAAADALLRQFNTMDEMPFWVDFTLGLPTLAAVAGATVAAAAVASVWPALRATRRDLAGQVQSSGTRSSDVRFGRTAGVMVVVQIAVSVVMLHGAVVMARGFAAYSNPPLHLPPNVLATSLSVGATRRAPGGGPAVTVAAGDVERAAAQIPGVIAAGVASALPRLSPTARLVEVEPAPGRTAGAARLAPSAEVSTGFFDVLDARPVAGRVFTAADYADGARRVAVVNAPFVREFFGGVSPLGRRFRVTGANGAGPWMEVVGVVPDLGLSVGDPSLDAGYYVPLDSQTNFVYLAMRTTGDPLTYAGPLRRALLGLDPQLVLNRMERLGNVASEDVAFFKWCSTALVGIGVVTLVLALAGVYAMMALIVTRRTREIGIRMALGASHASLAGAIVRRAAWQVGLGGAFGAALAVLSLNMRAVLVSRLGDGGTWTLPLIIALLVTAGLAATWLPLRRALAVRPAEALRAE